MRFRRLGTTLFGAAIGTRTRATKLFWPLPSSIGKVLVTLDKDFGGLAVLQGVVHCDIRRLVNFRVAEQAPVCLKVFADYSEDLRRGALVTAEPGRIRIRQTVK